METSELGASLSRQEYRSGERLVCATANNAVASPPTLRKELNLFDAVAIVVGTVIGSGIFLIPSSIAAQLNSLGAVLLVWVVGGILTLCGALSLAELGSIFPGSGGLCTYLRHVYGPLPAFLYAWALLVMIHSGSIAALAVAFGLYVGQIFLLNTVEMKMVSLMGILALTTFGGNMNRIICSVCLDSVLCAVDGSARI
jgi:amino acid transporter